MATMFVKQRVPDYERWKSVFDGKMAPERAKYGLQVAGVFRSVEDPDIVLLLIRVADMARAKEFSRSSILDEGRAEALSSGRTEAEVWFADDGMRVG